MPSRGEVLVAIINNRYDFLVAHDEHWYRISVGSAQKWLSDCWPPRWLALYQTKVFGKEAHSVRYYARIRDIREVFRWQLFSGEPRDERSARRYYQLMLEPLQQLPVPVFSQRLRRIVFIPTTHQKLMTAIEINDLFHDSPLEDRLWVEFKRMGIPAERQEFVRIRTQSYALDFAIYCAKGKVDVETDGDTWHANPEKAAEDNRRDNALGSIGWRVLRFSSHQIREETLGYCIPVVAHTVNDLGGLDDGGLVPRKVDLTLPGNERQLRLFDRM